MKTYNSVHWSLVKERGDASAHSCRCGQPARDWAYQHNGEPEIYDPESGRPYSEDLECYEAMCRSCHFRLDSGDIHRRMGQLVGRSNVLRAAADEEFAAKVSADRAQAARVANQIRRRCLDCGLTAHPAAMGAHLKGSKHRGYETL